MSHPQPHIGLTTCRGMTHQEGRGRIVTLWITSAVSYSSPVLTYILTEDLARAPGQLPYSAIAFCSLEIPLLTHMHMHTPWFKREQKLSLLSVQNSCTVVEVVHLSQEHTQCQKT